MELTQRALAGIIGAEEQTLRLWEKNRDKFMPATAERLLRALYSEALAYQGRPPGSAGEAAEV
jgi:putative transcriptional regulator